MTISGDPKNFLLFKYRIIICKNKEFV